MTELSLKRQELSQLPLRNIITSIELLNKMKHQNIIDKQFRQRMEVITKDLEGLFKPKEESRGLIEKPLTMTQVMIAGYIMFHVIFGFLFAWDYFLDSYPVTTAHESWNVECRCIHHRNNLELMES